MKPTSALAATAIAVLLPSSFASPIDSLDTLDKRDVPSVCEPTGAQRLSNYDWWDLSKVCQDRNAANACCITYLGDRPCRAETKQDLKDLKDVLAQQTEKSGLFSTARVGKWYTSYELFSNQKPDPKVVDIWNTALRLDDDDFDLDDAAVFANLQFTANTDKGQTRVTLNCK
ncbi:hypothetical protein MBLNU230_g3857t1 [Neophaeotheca triangularis]